MRVCRRRCFEKDWVVDLGVRSFFDSVPRDLMLKAVARHATSAMLAWARRTRVRRTVLGTALVATVAVKRC